MTNDSDVFGRKNGMGEKRSSYLETLDGIFDEPFSIVQKKKMGGFTREKRLGSLLLSKDSNMKIDLVCWKITRKKI